MNYLSELLKLPVLDVNGEKLGVVNDLGIATGEVFPHVTSLAFQGPGKTPFMISWRKYVDHVDETGVHLKTRDTDVRFSYLQPDELLLARDILNKQIVDTQGLKVVRVNDLKLSSSGENQLRLLGAEVGGRGLLRAIHPALERIAARLARAVGKPLEEHIIAWSYMDLLERSTQTIKLSVSHKTLDELHPADIADIIEQLDPRLRSQVFAQLDTAQAAEAISEFDDDELVAEVIEGMSDREASSMLALMDPDDAADLIEELDYEKAEKLLRLMGVKEERAIRNLLGYGENTAGRIMTSEFVALPATDTAADAIEAIRKLDEDFESIYYVYTLDTTGALTGVLSLRTLIVADLDARLSDIAYRDVVWVTPDLDQEDVADEMTKYNLVAVPVCDDARHVLGIVTVDDALDVIAEEHEETCRSPAWGRVRTRRANRRTCFRGLHGATTGCSCGRSPRVSSPRRWGASARVRSASSIPCAPCRWCCSRRAAFPPSCATTFSNTMSMSMRGRRISPSSYRPLRWAWRSRSWCSCAASS